MSQEGSGGPTVCQPLRELGWEAPIQPSNHTALSTNLEGVAVFSFSHKAMSNSFATLWIIACQAPLSMGSPK